jgi:hypothetical protein
MLEKALEKIDSEMGLNQDNQYMQVVGSFLLGHLKDNPDDAEKILSEDKTITKSLDEMQNLASKKKVGNCAMFTPAEGFAIVMKYFGIESAVDIMSTPNVKNEKAKSKVEFDISLKDFL